MNSQNVLFAFGINHKTAPLEAREKLYLRQNEICRLIEILRQTLSECMVLSTCNRTEIYGVCDSSEIDVNCYQEILVDFKNAGGVVCKEHFFSGISCFASRQIFNVATSLDSKIIGDAQILQQLKNAYQTAKQLKTTGRILNQLMQRALKIGKKVYAETSIHKGAVSISLAAISLAQKILGSLQNKNVLIIGAGETAKLTAKCLIDRQVGKIFVTNRTNLRATNLLKSLQKKNRRFYGEAIKFEEFNKYLDRIDFVISSTDSCKPILTQKEFTNKTNKILLIDIAIPRDIEPSVAENKKVILKNIDDLNDIVDRNYERRLKDLPSVKRIINKEMGEFLIWYYSLPLLPNMHKGQDKSNCEIADEALKVKDFLKANVSELHKIAMKSKGKISDDLQNHAMLVRKLREMKSGRI